jgi:hypothetical protein
MDSVECVCDSDILLAGLTEAACSMFPEVASRSGKTADKIA